jgi:hypothetical protein
MTKVSGRWEKERVGREEGMWLKWKRRACGGKKECGWRGKGELVVERRKVDGERRRAGGRK